jgi:hypothetical protein
LRGSIARVRYTNLKTRGAQPNALAPVEDSTDRYEQFAAALLEARNEAPESAIPEPIIDKPEPLRPVQPRAISRPPWLDGRRRRNWRRRIANAAAWTITVMITLATIVGMMAVVVGWDKSTKIADAAQDAVRAAVATASDLSKRLSAR